MVDEFSAQYKRLNPEQKRAVETIEGPVMILAGPGTGKTQTLAMRIANILKETQMDPWNILCLTFTDSGVVAMRERLISIIGTAAYAVRIHTFHSFCNEIIQDHPNLFVTARTWNMVSDVEHVEFIEELLDALPGTSPLKPFGDPYLYVKDIASNIASLKQEGISPAQFRPVLANIAKFIHKASPDVENFRAHKPGERTHAACASIHQHLVATGNSTGLPESLVAGIDRLFERYTERSNRAEGERAASSIRTSYKNELVQCIGRLERHLPQQKHMATLYEGYLTLMKERGRYDFEDMILLVVDAFGKYQDLLREYQEQFQYIHVDEYQDTNGAQNEVISLLGSFDESPNIFVVGDDKQSIYRFQGASLANMRGFYEAFRKHIQVISLKENYRNQPVILTAAGHVIMHNRESLAAYIPGMGDALIPTVPLLEKKIDVHVCTSEAAEDYLVGQLIEQLIRSGADPSSIAVLFRYNRDGASVLATLRQLGLPAQLEAGENILNDVLVQQFLSLLAVVNGDDSDSTLSKVLFFDWIGIDELDALKIIHYAGANRISLVSALSDQVAIKAGCKDPERFIRFITSIAQWRAYAANHVIQDSITHVFEACGLLSYMTGNNGRLPLLRSIMTLLKSAKGENATKHDMSLSDFLRGIERLRTYGIPLNVKPWQGSRDAVVLMTAHKAKGLQFDHVFLIRMNDKHWGNVREQNRLPLPQGFVRYDYVMAQENNEDERRLFYVSMTRARKTVTITRSRMNFSGKPTVASLFLYEIPPDAKEEINDEENVSEEEQRLANTLVTPRGNSDGNDLRSWLTSLLSTYVISVTHLNNYLECPRKFYMRNLLRVPSVRSLHQSLGSAVHGALDDFFREFEREGSVQKKSVLLAAFDRRLAREVLTAAQENDTKNVGREQLSAYYNRYCKEFVRDTLREYSFRSHGVVIDGVPITGMIDKIELIDGPRAKAWSKGAHVNVVDYKTGNPDRGLRKLRRGGDYFRQLVFYKLLCDVSKQFPYEMVSGEVDFIKQSEKKGFIKKKLTIDAADIEQLSEEIARVWKEIRELTFLDPNTGCGECEYCMIDGHRL